MRIERPDYQLAISYALRGRDGIVALFALDDRLTEIVRRASEPLVGQMRLTWWREALDALDRAPPPAEPILRALARHVLPFGASGAAMARMVDGWEALLEDPFGEEAIERHGLRGAALFEALAAVAGAADDAAEEAGRGWALADLSTHLRDERYRDVAASLARRHLRAARAHRWSRAGRPIGALALLARQELDRASGPARVGRLLWHRLTGR